MLSDVHVEGLWGRKRMFALAMLMLIVVPGLACFTSCLLRGGLRGTRTDQRVKAAVGECGCGCM